MWLIVIGVFIFICIFRLSSNSGSSNGTSTSKATQHTASTPKENALQYLTSDPREQGLAFAKINNNIIYCCTSHAGEFKIGSYESNAEGTYDVWNDDHSIKIGYVNPKEKEIFLTPGNVWADYKKRNSYSRAVPGKFLLLAAHWRWSNSELYDEETRQVIAKFTGDPTAAGAAFICLTYETLMYNKYYDAFHGWM